MGIRTQKDLQQPLDAQRGIPPVFSRLIVLNYQFKITRLNSHNKKVYTQNVFVFHLLYLICVLLYVYYDLL